MAGFDAGDSLRVQRRWGGVDVAVDVAVDVEVEVGGDAIYEAASDSRIRIHGAAAISSRRACFRMYIIEHPSRYGARGDGWDRSTSTKSTPLKPPWRPAAGKPLLSLGPPSIDIPRPPKDPSTTSRQRDSETARQRDTKIPRYQDTKIPRYQDTKIPRYQDTKIPRLTPLGVSRDKSRLASVIGRSPSHRSRHHRDLLSSRQTVVVSRWSYQGAHARTPRDSGPRTHLGAGSTSTLSRPTTARPAVRSLIPLYRSHQPSLVTSSERDTQNTNTPCSPLSIHAPFQPDRLRFGKGKVEQLGRPEVAKLAQSRPPPIRTHSVVASPPPLSPRTPSEKPARHHSRRKSGHGYVSEKQRPALTTRKTVHANGRAKRRDEEPGNAESFPQFCMSCEKQFLPANNTFLYCSEACRLHDQAPAYTRSHSYSAITPTQAPTSPPQSPYIYIRTLDEGPDIIPRFSPTQSRPRSYFHSETPYQAPAPAGPTYSNSIYTNSRSSMALASLRELATALPRNPHRTDPETPPKSSASSIGRTGSGVWNYIPFTQSKTAPTTPGSSFTSSCNTVSQSYTGSAHGQIEDYGAAAKSYGHAPASAVAGGYGNTGGMGMDRPLPPRSGPGGYGHRPRSIDLVTPFSGGH